LYVRCNIRKQVEGEFSLLLSVGHGNGSDVYDR
jgi:hypothetical protein